MDMLTLLKAFCLFAMDKNGIKLIAHNSYKVEREKNASLWQMSKYNRLSIIVI